MIEHNLSFEDYRALPQENWSLIKELAKSPRHYRIAKAGLAAADTGTLLFGRAVHCSILEPDSFNDQWACWEGGFTRDGKPTKSRLSAAYKEWAAANEDKEHLTDEEFDRVLGCTNAVQGHKRAGTLLQDAQTEITVTWEDKATGVQCKGRVDILPADGRVTDLKTTRDADPVQFGDSVVKFGYAGQLAFYVDGSVAAGLDVDPARAAIVAVESQPPHDVIVYRIGEEVLQYGRRLYREFLVRLAACMESNSWPGRCPEGEMDLVLPAWTQTRKAS